MREKKILVLDDKHFSRICHAILEREGFSPEVPEAEENPGTLHRWRDYALVIASYPMAEEVVGQIRGAETPVIVLSDIFNRELTEFLSQFKVCRCFIKPLDFEHFIQVIADMLHGEISQQGGYEIV